MYRWMRCPGSIELCAQYPRVESKYALEGTFAHGLCEICLRRGEDATKYKGGWLHKAPGDSEVCVSARFPEGDFETLKVNNDMIAAVQEYLDTIRADQDGSMDIGIEHRFHLDWVHDDLYGTNDCNLGQPWGVIRCYDYKHGQGYAVDVVDEDGTPNPQLMYYLLGAIGDGNPYDYEEAEIVIVQPRAAHKDGPVRRLRMPIEDVFKWQAEVLLPAVEYAQTSDELHAGDWCRFCDAKVGCPEHSEMVHKVTQGCFTPVGKSKPLPRANTLDDDMLGLICAKADETISWIKSVVGFAQGKLERGEVVSGQKLVAKKAIRAWKNPAATESALLQQIGQDAYTKKLLSPAQAEKAFKASGRDPKSLEPLWEKRSSGLTIASDSDPRPAALPENINPFQAVPKNEDW